MNIDINTQDENGNTPLMNAIIDKKMLSAKKLINDYKKTINPNKMNNQKKTALMLLCSHNVDSYGSVEYDSPDLLLTLVDSLLNLCADLNMKDNEGFTALMLASKYVHPGLVTRLLETNRVSDINEKTNSYFSPLTALILAIDDKNRSFVDDPRNINDYSNMSRYTRQQDVMKILKAAMENKLVSDGRRRKAGGRRRLSPKHKQTK